MFEKKKREKKNHSAQGMKIFCTLKRGNTSVRKGEILKIETRQRGQKGKGTCKGPKE